MYVIKNALVYTMADAGVVKADILVENGKVAAIGENLNAETVIDAAGKVVTPGFVDAHSHIGGIADLTPLAKT